MYLYWQAAHSYAKALQRQSLLKFRHEGRVAWSNRLPSQLSKDCCGGHLCWQARFGLLCQTLVLAHWYILRSPILFPVPSLNFAGILQFSLTPMSEDSSPFSHSKRADVEANNLPPRPADYTDNMLLCPLPVFAAYTTGRHTERIVKI